MDEKRKFDRLFVEKDKIITIQYERRKEEVSVVDISATGIKLSSCRSLNIGTIIYATIPVLSTANLYYIKGEVVRIEQKKTLFEISVEFEMVSTHPLKE